MDLRLPEAVRAAAGMFTMESSGFFAGTGSPLASLMVSGMMCRPTLDPTTRKRGKSFLW
jgi:hypothetical protein